MINARLALAALISLLVAAPAAPSAPLFRDVAAEAGIDFVHSNGSTGEKHYREIVGSGACFLDYDGDGRLDLYLVTCVGANRLYRNVGGLRFEDVTEATGTGDEGYGMAAVAADVDNDGDPDLFVTNYGPNRFYENRGDGTFVERSKAAGLDDARWGCGVAFFDADGDALLDLYVVNYVQVADPDANRCDNDGVGIRIYCAPPDYPREPDVFYRNRGDGTFEEATDAFGFGGRAGRGLGVIATDFDRDGKIDVYVSNDLDGNFLFRNLGGGKFEEVGMIAGVSHSEYGIEMSGMGVAAADYDNDGWIDLFVTNFMDQVNNLYHNEGEGLFFDESASSGLGPMSVPYIGWGTYFLDFDLDGWRDLFVGNGHVESDAERVDPTTTWKQPDFIYHNRGDGTFEDVTQDLAPVLLSRESTRGAAFGDPDDDGDQDVVVMHQNAPIYFLENGGGTGHHWIGFRTVGTKSNRDGVGARLDLYAGDLTSSQETQAGGSHLCGNDPRVLFGLGARAAVDSVVVLWPSGQRDVRVAPEPDRYHVLREGE